MIRLPVSLATVDDNDRFCHVSSARLIYLSNGKHVLSPSHLSDPRIGIPMVFFGLWFCGIICFNRSSIRVFEVWLGRKRYSNTACAMRYDLCPYPYRFSCGGSRCLILSAAASSTSHFPRSIESVLDFHSSSSIFARACTFSRTVTWIPWKTSSFAGVMRGCAIRIRSSLNLEGNCPLRRNLTASPSSSAVAFASSEMERRQGVVGIKTH
mmetsp:Transcript_54142/g.82045  ORF Transcript_54142/g.82045 Transcript_54142/m.82045 type:complete len:210 (+) Transcript_54142:264-893(+)